MKVYATVASIRASIRKKLESFNFHLWSDMSSRPRRQALLDDVITNFGRRMYDLEGRLDRGCGSRWLTQLERCVNTGHARSRRHDTMSSMPGVASLLLQLLACISNLPNA